MRRKHLPKFSYYHTSFPFKEPLYHNNGFVDYRDFEEYLNKIPKDLYIRCIEWAEEFEREFYEDEFEGFTFASQKIRAKIDREYINLAEELFEAGFEFKLSMWW